MWVHHPASSSRRLILDLEVTTVIPDLRLTVGSIFATSANDFVNGSRTGAGQTLYPVAGMQDNDTREAPLCSFGSVLNMLLTDAVGPGHRVRPQHSWARSCFNALGAVT